MRSTCVDGYIVIVFPYIASLIFHFISLIQYCIEKEKTLHRFYIVLFVYFFYSKLILCFLRILLDCWTRLSARLYSSIYSSWFIFAFFSFTQSLRFIFNLYVSSGVICISYMLHYIYSSSIINSILGFSLSRQLTRSTVTSLNCVSSS